MSAKIIFNNVNLYEINKVMKETNTKTKCYFILWEEILESVVL